MQLSQLKNTGGVKIENWYLVFQLPNEITNIWNARIAEFDTDTSTYTITNDSWNQDIGCGQSVSFGFTAKGVLDDIPENYSLPGKKVELDTDTYSVEYIVTEDWDDGYNAKICITNNTEKTLEDWQIEFDLNDNITTIWNASITEHVGNHYVISNATYNSDIAPNTSVEFGYNVAKGNSNITIQNIKVYERTIESEISGCLLLDGEITDETDLTLYIDSAYESYPFQLYVIENEMSLLATIEEAEYVIDLSTRNNSFACLVKQDVEGEEFVSNYLHILYENGVWSIECTDTDNDELPDYFETFLGTDVYAIDSDDDGLTDYDEVKLHMTDPLDFDTDFDYMEDGIEVAYKQDPLSSDSDNDGIEDGYETYTVTLDSEEIENDGIVIPSLTIEIEGCYIASLFVTEIDDTDEYINEEISGYIGSAYDFNVSDRISDKINATITFSLDDSYFENSDFAPAIYYFNEDTLELEKVENQTIPKTLDIHMQILW